MGIMFGNNAAGALSAPANGAALTLLLGVGQGALFPQPLVPGDYFKITVQQSATMEIMKCTARSGDTLTVVRAQEGTTAQNFTATAAVSHLITAGTFRELRDEVIASALASATALAQLWGPPVGTPLPWAGLAAPSGYLLCAGQAVVRATYPLLFAALGTTWGPGNGTTTFNLPDFRGRVLAGPDSMGGTPAGRLAGAALPAAALGNEAVTLGTTHLPAHGHTASATAAGGHSHPLSMSGSGDHGHTGTTDAAGSHQHGVPLSGVNAGPGAGAVGPGASSITTDPAGSHSHPFTTGFAGDHVHSGTATAVADHTHPVTVNSTGDGTAHPNVQPTITTNWILRAA